MGEIEWAMWANEQAIVSCAVTFLGGILGVAGMFRNWQFAVFAICASVLIFIVEYPRGKRRKGHTIERSYQSYVARVVNACGPVTSNYYVRFVFHLVLCVPCFFLLPTLLGGVSLLITAIIYFVAAIKGEQWIPCKNVKEKPAVQRLESLKPPSHPPPRRPPSSDIIEDAC